MLFVIVLGLSENIQPSSPSDNTTKGVPTPHWPRGVLISPLRSRPALLPLVHIPIEEWEDADKCPFVITQNASNATPTTGYRLCDGPAQVPTRPAEVPREKPLTRQRGEGSYLTQGKLELFDKQKKMIEH